jgi:hypothetical protein
MMSGIAVSFDADTHTGTGIHISIGIIVFIRSDLTTTFSLADSSAVAFSRLQWN